MKKIKLRKFVIKEMAEAVVTGRISKGQLWKARRIKFPLFPRLLGTSTKVIKNEKENALTSIVYLAPASESVAYGGHNVCPWASKGCSMACLGINSKRLRMSTGRNSKAWKTLLFLYKRNIFEWMLFNEIKVLVQRAAKKNLKPSVRLNGTSDIAWESIFPDIFYKFPQVQFYDYTKSINRYNAFLQGKLPPNYYLTFSHSEINLPEVKQVLAMGGNVAMVFKSLPKAMERGYEGFRVYNGDLTDYRPSDPIGVVVGLSIKGHAKDNGAGFIINNE